MKEFVIKPVCVCNKVLLKTKIKSYSNEATNFHAKEMLKTGPHHTCLPVINVDSALKEDENYYPKVFWKECKYIEN